MSRRLILSLLLSFAISCFAESDRVLNNSWTFVIGEKEIADTYLSPLEYSGLNYALHASHGRFYDGSNLSWAVTHKWNYASLINPAYTALMINASLQLSFNTLYHWNLFNNFSLSLGGEIEGYGAIKYLSRNVNNPASGDIQLMLKAALQLDYIIKTKPVDIIFQYNVSTPILGAMFVPEYGQPYYFIYEQLPQSLNETIKFASLHNNHGATGSFNIDLAFNKFTLRTSFYHSHTFWHANQLSFYQKQLSGGIGIVLNTSLFWGKNHEK